MTVILNKRLLTADEYLEMARVGILRPDEHVELIGGEIVNMSPQGHNHSKTISLLVSQLAAQDAERKSLLWIQSTVKLSDTFLPEPDICILKSSFRTEQRYPEARDIQLLIEVSGTSLGRDRDVKLPLYAESGVREVWIVDLEAEVIEAYRTPNAGRRQYEEKRLYTPGEEAAPSALPGLAVDPAALFPKKES